MIVDFLDKLPGAGGPPEVIKRDTAGEAGDFGGEIGQGVGGRRIVRGVSQKLADGLVDGSGVLTPGMSA